jgi:hypothetical protein
LTISFTAVRAAEAIVDITDARLLSVKQIGCEFAVSEKNCTITHFYTIPSLSSSSRLPFASTSPEHQQTSTLPQRSLLRDSTFFHPQSSHSSSSVTQYQVSYRSLTSDQWCSQTSTTYVHHQPLVLTTLAPISNLRSPQSLCHPIIPADP